MYQTNSNQFFSEVSSDFPTIVVVGCSSTHPQCSRKLHPSKKKFFTIDAREEFKPDFCMDITDGGIPKNLNKKFQLTILEHLPHSVYNFVDYSDKNLKCDGQNGLSNILELTADNGFVLIIGNSREYRFRASLGKLNYLELASNIENDIYPVIVAKNQTLTASQVVEQLSTLPSLLKDIITMAQNYDHCSPLPLQKFCTLNYHIFDQYKALVISLNDYIENYCKNTKYEEYIKIADQVIHVLLGNIPHEFLPYHLLETDKELSLIVAQAKEILSEEKIALVPKF